MTVVNPATEVPTAAPAPAAPPVGPTPAVATPAPDVGDDVRVSRSSLADWDGSWHNVAEAAKKHRALGPMAEFAQELVDYGASPAQVREAVIQAQRAGSLGEPTPPPAEPGVTRADLDAAIGRIGEQFGTALTERDATNEQRAQRTADTRAAQETEVKFRAETLTALGYPAENEDGTPNVPSGLVRLAFNDALNKVLVEAEPEGLDEQARADYYAMPTQEHLDGAAKAVEPLKGLSYEMAAQVALEQEKTPTASLGTGTAAAPSPPKFEDMTPEDRAAAITQGVEIERPDDSPDKDFSE